MHSLAPISPRLEYVALCSDNSREFHHLALNPHVREYLLDGMEVPEAWVQSTVETCANPFLESGVGLWLLYERSKGGRTGAPIGFAGYWVFEELGSEPQLLYALTQAHTGRGVATEAAATLIRFARRQINLQSVSAAVDAPNHASIRVLQKLGFEQVGTTAGHFGHTQLFSLATGRPAAVLHSERLVLRPWGDSDFGPFAEMNADPAVMEFVSDPLTRVQSDALAERIQGHFRQHGYGLWAVAEREGRPFVGFVGLSRPTFQADFTPCVEVGWRLAQSVWGQGYATEAAKQALVAAFVEIGLPEVVSFTVPSNLPSRRVMEKLGMNRDPRDDFEHPGVPQGHPLRSHVLYRMDLARFRGTPSNSFGA